MVEISLRIEGTKAVLDCGLITLTPGQIEERVRQITHLLERLLEADIALMSLSDPMAESRMRGIAAQNMMMDAAISSATVRAELLKDIISGRESIANHGFPEFVDE